MLALTHVNYAGHNNLKTLSRSIAFHTPSHAVSISQSCPTVILKSIWSLTQSLALLHELRTHRPSCGYAAPAFSATHRKAMNSRKAFDWYICHFLVPYLRNVPLWTHLQVETHNCQVNDIRCTPCVTELCILRLSRSTWLSVLILVAIVNNRGGVLNLRPCVLVSCSWVTNMDSCYVMCNVVGLCSQCFSMQKKCSMECSTRISWCIWNGC